MIGRRPTGETTLFLWSLKTWERCIKSMDMGIVSIAQVSLQTMYSTDEHELTNPTSHPNRVQIPALGCHPIHRQGWSIQYPCPGQSQEVRSRAEYQWVSRSDSGKAQFQHRLLHSPCLSDTRTVLGVDDWDSGRGPYQGALWFLPQGTMSPSEAECIRAGRLTCWWLPGTLEKAIQKVY